MSIESVLNRVEKLYSDGTASSIREANRLCIEHFRDAAYELREANKPPPRAKITMADYYPAGALEEMP